MKTLVSHTITVPGLARDPWTKDKITQKDWFIGLSQTGDGFFKGAAVGQYYLAKSKKFVEEWGEVVEPIGLTYYTMLGMGNILLLEPNNNELKNRLRLGAESLLKWQKTDGSWPVAYDRYTEKELFKDIQYLRPTFYGLIVAHRILKDDKYMAAAKR